MSTDREKVIDQLLVVRCQQGDSKCADLLVRRWQRRLWQYARRVTGNDDAAWDVVQDAWMAILRRIRTLGDPAWFAAWALRIVRNKAVDYCRRAERQRRVARDAAEQRWVHDAPSVTDQAREVSDAIRQLPRDRQELLALKYGAGLNVVEIAVVLGIPSGTVKSRLHHAREQLRSVLEGDES